MTAISSPQNARIRQLRALAERKNRDRSGLYLIEGVRAVAEAVQQRCAIETLIIAPQLMSHPRGWEVYATLQAINTPTLQVSAEVFERLAAKEVTQGIAAVVRQRWERLADVQPGASCWVALDSVQYPGNLGTILRTSDAVGGAGVILLGHATDPYDPICVRASLGAIFSQRLVRASLDELAAWARQHGTTIVGTSPAAPTAYRAVRYTPPLVVLMGSERHGLSAAQQALCDHVVSLPMLGRSDSLNLAVATGVLLYEILHQQLDG
jgi:RNA methyltransferase, TrmH family